MGTHASVAIGTSKNCIDAIYVQSDGFLNRLGRVLFSYFNTAESAKELVSLGDASCIHPRLNPDPLREHSFECRQEGVSFFYHRDRNEDWDDVSPQHYTSYAAWHNSQGVDFNYLFSEGEWWFADGSSSELTRLKDMEGIQSLKLGKQKIVRVKLSRGANPELIVPICFPDGKYSNQAIEAYIEENKIPAVNGWEPL